MVARKMRDGAQECEGNMQIFPNQIKRPQLQKWKTATLG